MIPNDSSPIKFTLRKRFKTTEEVSKATIMLADLNTK
jgi:hypothetical protein